MDNSEEPALCPYGTPLEPLEEDEVPTKKRIAVEDQIVTDENGRRRFHGAFTGGFSAGFWNTVGSLEGWKPKSFKSSRSEKAEKPSRQLPTDFMDDEDLGEFGIAPQRIQAKEDFAKSDQTTSNKRKLMVNSGPIPGIPVLQQLLQPPKEKVAVRLLRRMGWKPGQGIGARQTKSEKTKSNKRNNRELYVMRMYGCATKPEDSASECPSDSSEGEVEDDVTFAPDDFEPFVCSVKDNVFGLGYSGLSQLGSQASSHVNLFSPLEVMGKDNKKLSIRGQAFGVGALEEEDEDIYARDDMSKYDFTLGNKKKDAKKRQLNAQDQGVLEGFAASSGTNNQRAMHRVDLKANFQPRNWLQRKTRFDTLSDEKAAALKQNDAHKLKGLGRHDLTPDERGTILKGNFKPDGKESNQGEGGRDKSYLQQINEKYKTREERAKKMLELVSSKADNFVKGGLITESGVEVDQSVKSENKKILSEAKEITKALGSTSGSFRPFAGNEAKQQRYEKFIEANLRQEDEIKAFLATIQPLHLSEWDREMERKEFIQAQSIYKPLNGTMSERFVSKAFVNDLVEEPKPEANEKVNVVVERTKTMWKPSAILCKRFNIPEPYGGALVEPKVQEKNKFSVFDYIENSVNSKKDFVTPVIIPKHVEKPKIVKPQADFEKDEQRKSEKKNVEETLPSEKPTIDVPQPRETFHKDTKKAKTELEIRIEETKNKHPSEKKDLFKCIFDSSSDEEDAGNDDVSDLKNDNSVPLDVVRSLTKPSAPINLLRNNSPPRGIFAALLTESKPKVESKVVANEEPQTPNKISFIPSSERHAKEKSELSDVYGPKVPTQLIGPSSKTLNESEIDKKLIELLASRPSKSSRIVEKWVEKKDKSRKKSKKEKKEKKKHHKDRSKHKKAKKKKDK